MAGSEEAEEQEAHALFLTLFGKENNHNNNTSEMIEQLQIQVALDGGATVTGLIPTGI